MGKGQGSGGTNNFNRSGPKDLTHVDWQNPDHKRIVAACLVMGVYVLERDRQKKHKDALAVPWFGFFKFQLLHELNDPGDKSIYGAIYRFKTPSILPPAAPKYVIAFRGTMLKKRSGYQDLKLDLAILLQYFHRTKRCKMAIAEVKRIVKDNPNVWLAGHSLGSALALQAGKNAAKANVSLETFLFNPPFPRLKQWISKAKGRVTAKLVALFKGRHQLSEDDELTKTEWSPYLFVNKHDLICSGYIKYLEQRTKMTTEQARATMYSVAALVKNWIKAKIFRKENPNGYYEPFYLLPRASLITNTGKTGCHEIAQWWSPNLQLERVEDNTFCPVLEETTLCNSDLSIVEDNTFCPVLEETTLCNSDLNIVKLLLKCGVPVVFVGVLLFGLFVGVRH